MRRAAGTVAYLIQGSMVGMPADSRPCHMRPTQNLLMSGVGFGDHPQVCKKIWGLLHHTKHTHLCLSPGSSMDGSNGSMNPHS